jgi:hypothetical protein
MSLGVRGYVTACLLLLNIDFLCERLGISQGVEEGYTLLIHINIDLLNQFIIFWTNK